MTVFAKLGITILKSLVKRMCPGFVIRARLMVLISIGCYNLLGIAQSQRTRNS